MNKTVERVARRLVPSTSLLSHNPLFKLIVNASDIPAKLMWKEFRRLPPNHMRIRIGVGNRFFSNQMNHLVAAEGFWLYWMSAGAVNHQSTIVDIGCGCGRFAHHLRDSNFQGRAFCGRYYGIDVDQEMLEWCRRNFDAERFEFFHSTDASKSYKQDGTGSTFNLPIPDGSVDLVFSTSLYTHLLEPEMRNYSEEAVRILKPGASMSMSFFCLDYPPPTYGGRHTFSHRIGNAAVESLKVPEAAVAYTEAFMLQVAKEVGFSSAEVIPRPAAGWQSVLVARR